MLASTCTVEPGEKVALASVSGLVNYNDDWIVDSGCSNHMTGDKEKLNNLSTYNGKRMVVTANNSKLPITHIGQTTVVPKNRPHHMKLQNVLRVEGMRKNLLSVSQLTDFGNYVVFRPKDVKVYRDFKPTCLSIMKGKRSEAVYVLSTQTAYVDKTRKNETPDLWHARLGHVSYLKLKAMMKKSMLKGLPQLEV